MTAANTISYSEFLDREAPFMDYVGLRTCLGESGERKMVLRLERQHMNIAFNTHGGVILTLLDVAMASVCRLSDPDQRSCVTVEMKASFLRPAGTAGESIEAHGILRHATRMLAFCDGELRNEQGELLATASGTFKYLNDKSGSSDG